MLKRKERRKREWEREVSQADRWINRQMNVDSLKRQNLARDDRDRKITQTERAGKGKRKRTLVKRRETDETSSEKR